LVLLVANALNSFVCLVILEDCGAGDGIDKSLGTASGHAIKSAITDAMKRAARHFGEKTGNALYHNEFKLNCAPATLKEAFEQFDVQRAKSRFGFDKDRTVSNHQSDGVSQQTTQYQTNANSTTTVKQETRTGTNNQTSYAMNQPKPTPIDTQTAQPAHRTMPQQLKPTPVVTNTSTAIQKTPYNQSNNPSAQSNSKPATAPYVTPHHASNTTGTSNANRLSTTSTVFSQYNATPALKMISVGSNVTNTGRQSFDSNAKENSNPQQNSTVSAGGLNLPPRPSTSRGQQSDIADGMLGLASSILAMNGQTDSIVALKPIGGSQNVKNPYNTLG
jgi:DNA repair and recombination protein RAD52